MNSSAAVATLITFPPLSASSPNELAFQAYCLSPPDDSCQFGPCPNPDITGIGQQISLYVTSTSLALIILYDTQEESHLSLYAHFANIYAILVATYVSLGRGQLTQSDSVFVLAFVASPVSLYFWMRHIAKLRNAWKINALDGLLEFLPTLMIFFSFLLWIVMVGFTLSPLAALPFSQKNCTTVKENSTWMSLIWYIVYIVQNALIVLGCGLLQYRSVGDITISSDIDIVQWTRNLLDGVILPMTGHRAAAILFAIQASAISTLPGPIFPFGPITLLSGLVLIVTFLSSGRPSSFFSLETLALTMFILTIFATSVGSAISFIPNNSISTIPGNPFAVICMLLWTQRSSSKYHALQKPWAFLSHVFMILVGTSVQFIMNILKIKVLRDTPVYIHYIFWIYPWMMMRRPKAKSLKELMRVIWVDLLDSAPLLKFNQLFAVPHIAWIWATVSTNSKPTYNLTFGQLLALFLLLFPMWSVLRMTYKQRRTVMHALWMIETYHVLPTNEIPLMLVTSPDALADNFPQTPPAHDTVLNISGHSTVALLSPNSLAPPVTLNGQRRRAKSTA